MAGCLETFLEGLRASDRQLPRDGELVGRTDALQIELAGVSYALQQAEHRLRVQIRAFDFPRRPEHDLLVSEDFGVAQTVDGGVADAAAGGGLCQRQELPIRGGVSSP